MLFGKLKGFLFKMKMKEKLFINNMVLSIAPLIIITIFSYRYFVSNTMETMTDFINLFRHSFHRRYRNTYHPLTIFQNHWLTIKARSISCPTKGLLHVRQDNVQEDH